MAYSPVDDAFWIVGDAIMKVSRDGRILSNHPLPEGACAFTEVAVDRDRGGAWVLEYDSPDLPRSQRRLWKVARDGTATVTHRFSANVLPRALVCVGGRPWLAVVKNFSRGDPTNRDREVRRFDLDGSPTSSISLPASDITVGVPSGSIWLRFKDRILRVDPAGNTLQTIPLRSRSKGGKIVAF